MKVMENWIQAGINLMQSSQATMRWQSSYAALDAAKARAISS
jgi:hypothetical protein